MTGRPAHRWLMLGVALLLVAGHAVVFRYARSHLSLSAAVAAGVIALVASKYLALRRWHRASRDPGHH